MATERDRSAGQWRGVELGSRTVGYSERDAILYALAVGAAAEDLGLVFEERLRVLPTFGLTLAQWAPDALGARGAFDTRTAVHGSQRLEMLAPLPRTGSLSMTASVAEVWDKGSAAIFELVVKCECFVATWALFAPGCGAFGGERGPAPPMRPESAPDQRFATATARNQAALYRLLGDRHHMHIDPAAAAAAGQPRPFLHGLCTLAATTLAVARNNGAHPATLRRLEGRFAAPVFPGDQLSVDCWRSGPNSFEFGAAVGNRTVLTGGSVSFD